ncbi:MAG: hypothetical protein JWO17_747 [Actinomycetia bacterium]|jgi:hypothetical protein|nr:hypothetical protein [Actinomycetes bacterium]
MPTPEELRVELARATTLGLVTLCRSAEKRHGLPRALMLAIASRETGCRDIVGDFGHGRGVFQIDDRFHHEWLAAHAAAAPGALPPLKAAAELAATLLAGGLDVARTRALKDEAAVKFAACAYNAGTGGALDGLRRGDPDLATTGRDYGSDVVRRMRAFRALERGEAAQQ